MGNKRDNYLEEFAEILKEKGEPMYNPGIHNAIFERIANNISKIQLLGNPDSTRTTVDYFLRTLADEKKVIHRLPDKRYSLVIWNEHEESNALNIHPIIENEQYKTGNQKLIEAFGREWKRSLYVMNGTSIVGKLKKDYKTDTPKYFDDCAGIYLLHKDTKVVYAGQAKCLSERLSQHLRDDKKDLWDSFSWFALYDMDAKTKAFVEYKIADVIDSFEAILIDVLNPRANMKSGNHYNQKEYEQIETGIMQ